MCGCCARRLQYGGSVDLPLSMLRRRRRGSRAGACAIRANLQRLLILAASRTACGAGARPLLVCRVDGFQTSM